MGMNASARREQLIQTYIDEHGYTAIVVDPRGRLCIWTPFKWGAPIAGAWWCADAAKARDLVAGVEPAGDPDETIRRFLIAAERARIRLTDHDTLLARAAGAVDLVEARLADMQATGGMRSLNVEYQDRRLRAKETGKNFEPSWTWFHRKKMEMVKAVAMVASGRKPHKVAPPDDLRYAPDNSKRKRGGQRPLRARPRSFPEEANN